MTDQPKHYDPRMGDESGDELEPPSRAVDSSSPLATPRSHYNQHSHRHVRLDAEPTTFGVDMSGQNDVGIERGDSRPSDGTEGTRVGKEGGPGKEEKDGSASRVPRVLRKAGNVLGKVTRLIPFDTDMSWIPSNFTWSKIKPVIRSAIVAWISLLFVIIPRLETLLGQVRFPLAVEVFHVQ